MNLALDFESNSLSFAVFQKEMDRILDFRSACYNKSIDKVCVAVSGGADSLALLFLANKWCETNNRKLYCVTVDHRLRDESLEEALFVKDICSTLNVCHSILTWQHSNANIPHAKLENTAREARYKLIADFCEEHDVNTVMTGHHWNDQLETFEMRKQFSSSSCGLAGMSQLRSLAHNLWLIRPLLHFSKQHLQDFMRQQNISWKEDPMNAQEKFFRVNCRNKILSYDRQQVLEISQQIILLGKQRHVIEQRAVDFIKRYCEFSNYGYAVIDITELRNQLVEVQCEVLKRVIWNIGGKKYAPSISSSVLSDILNKKMNTIGNCLIKLKKTHVYVFRENRHISSVAVNSTSNSILWDNRFLIEFNVLLENIVIESSSKYEDENMPRNAFVGYPCVYQNNKNHYIIDKKNYNILFQNKINLFDVFV